MGEPTPTTAAVPLPEALTVLLAAVESSKLPDAVRAAAMAGILRHAEAGIRNARDLQLAHRGHASFDGRGSADGCAGCPASRGSSPRPSRCWGCWVPWAQDNAVFKAMLKTVSETKLPLCTRSIAAESLGRLNYSGAAGIDPAEAAAALGTVRRRRLRTEELRIGRRKPDSDRVARAD